ncbi:MAG: alpha,6-mannosyltransferase, partial [Chloroflexota bacterium]|nr:alpha,6-mannosyltransferase [Chloroflexota bacterium]
MTACRLTLRRRLMGRLASSRSQWGLYACGVALLGWAAALAVVPPGVDIPRHVGLTLLAWAVYVAALGLTLSLRRGGLRRDLLFICIVAVGMRIPLAATPPSLSDDVYRAVWDARLVHHGINPYAYSPGAPELEWLRDGVIWPRVNAPQQRTP